MINIYLLFIAVFDYSHKQNAQKKDQKVKPKKLLLLKN